MNWPLLVFRLYRSRDDLAKLFDLVKPVLDDVMQVWPEVQPLAKRLIDDIGPGLLDQNKLPKGVIRNVDWIQQSLNRLVDAKLTVDGNYGDDTKAAVKVFQKKHGLWVDGWVGPDTFLQMEAELYKLFGIRQ